jgi:hypothetical protein
MEAKKRKKDGEGSDDGDDGDDIDEDLSKLVARARTEQAVSFRNK